MNAAGGVTHVVGQVDLGSLAEISLRKRPIAEPGGDEGVKRRAQRTAMGGAGFVIAEVRLQHCAERDHICLLDRLRATHALRSEMGVNRHGRGSLAHYIDLIELEIASELLEELGCRIETRRQLPSQRTPRPGVLLGKVK